MDVTPEIEKYHHDPEQMEMIFRTYVSEGKLEQFRQAIVEKYNQNPEDLLLAAWYYRLIGEEKEKLTSGKTWAIAIITSVLTGLSFWWLSGFDELYLEIVPLFLILWSPIAAVYAVVFLVTSSRRKIGMGLFSILGLAIFSSYVLIGARWESKINAENYLVLMIFHLPLLAWIALGVTTLGFKSNPKERFAFLKKSIEVILTAGVYLIGGVALGGITIGLFAAINLELPDVILRLIIAGGFGLLPIISLITVYNPLLPPDAQDFSGGLSRFIAILMRFLIALAIVVLGVYILVIPFRFFEPFHQRDLLIVYNILLFAIIGMILGVIPLDLQDVPKRYHRWMKNGILVISGLTVLVNIYALSAILYRTIEGGITINRLAVIGWNVINIYILALLVLEGIRKKKDWLVAFQHVFCRATNLYAGWGVFLVVSIPLLFR